MGICGMSSLLSPVQTPAAWGAVRGWVVSLSRRRATGGRQVMGVRGCVPAPTCSCGLSLNSQRTRPLSQQQAFSSVTLQPAPSNPLLLSVHWYFSWLSLHLPHKGFCSELGYLFSLRSILLCLAFLQSSFSPAVSDLVVIISWPRLMSKSNSWSMEEFRGSFANSVRQLTVLA